MNPSAQSSTSDSLSERGTSNAEEKRPAQTHRRLEWSLVKREFDRYYFHIPALAVGYAVHRLFRRYVPRQSVPWTSLRLSEVYSMWGIGASLAFRNMYALEAAFKDKDLAVVAVAGSRDASASVRRTVLQDCEDGIQDPRGRIRELLPAIRYSSYDTGSLRSKVLWWHDHIWADKDSYEALAATIVYRNLQADPAWTPRHLTDFDICTTFIAQHVSNRTIIVKRCLWGLFGFSAPVAMELRRSGGSRPWHLPAMNLTQRLLIGLLVYIEASLGHHDWSRLQDIKDKHQVATAVVRAFGKLDV
ncbi:hypothetical protein K466DRAFT_524596 [Polyporus arcularius HHB13444]|uniref:Uncharacterized protein n=1 Tax=Polyporus arcularius HHB13444 TaxID=1314778 RepID=A0A5C3PC55_9APHY|nr:hypothetical protein K466DRAFT_524596 [Polyporus arcularius HHB13444]